MLVCVGEVKDERGAIFEFDEQTLLQSEIPAINNVDYLNQ